MLEGAFGFYGFSISLNIGDQIDIANRAYIRFYKKKINDILMDTEAVRTELESNQRLLKGFKQDSERSDRKIKELEIKEAIVQEERVTLKLEADRKVQKISKEYVDLYKTLAKQFEKYKEFILFEMESHEMIREGMEKVISKKGDSIDDLKEALSVPRQHYKFIDNLQADQIVAQKDEIIVNFGDMLEIWSNKKIKATSHRVIGTNKERFSIPFFCNPQYDTIISEQTKIIAGEYLSERYNSTYIHKMN